MIEVAQTHRRSDAHERRLAGTAADGLDRSVETTIFKEHAVLRQALVVIRKIEPCIAACSGNVGRELPHLPPPHRHGGGLTRTGQRNFHGIEQGPGVIDVTGGLVVL